MEGTYPLPEAQMDRFLCKIQVATPTKNELIEIMKRTTGSNKTVLEKKLSTNQLIDIQKLVKEVIIADDMLEYAADLVVATHPEQEDAPEIVRQYVEYGSGPRGLQSIIKLAKSRAVINGRFHVSIADIKTVVKPALRHRLLLNYEFDPSGLKVDDIVDQLVEALQQGQKV